MPDQSNWSVMRLDKECGRYRAVTAARYCSNLSRGPPAGKNCLSLTSRLFHPSDRNAVYSRTRPDLRGVFVGGQMTILQQPPQSGTGHTGKRWYRFGHASEAVRHTEAWEHENLAEEQARWERSDPAYARICEEVRQSKKKDEEPSRRAGEAKAEWDARAAPQRQGNDDAEKAHHASKLKADQTGETPNGDLTGGLGGAASTTNGSFNPNTPDRLRGARRLMAPG